MSVEKTKIIFNCNSHLKIIKAIQISKTFLSTYNYTLAKTSTALYIYIIYLCKYVK